MKLTPSQRQATQRIGQDVCVVAGPGSGKTRVLVERFCWLVKDKGVSPLRVLAITFTEKAATEIKQRLIEAFGSRPELREQIERAYVSTIHGFCARLLRENPIKAGVDPEFAVMDEPQSQAELLEAVHQALDQLFEERPSDFRSLLDAIYASTDLAGSLLSVYQAMRTTGLNPSRTNLSRARQQAVRSDAIQLLATLLSELHDLLAKASTPISQAQSRHLDSLRAWVQRASGLGGSPVSAAHFEVLDDFPRALPRLASGSHLKQIRDERIPYLEAALATEFYAMPRILLSEVLERTDRIYRQRKKEISALDFSDLEEHAIELLNRNPAVRASVRQSFDQIVMDELQDTNRLQWILLNLLKTPNRFFAVGDINQSIYGFRHADPNVFREYRDQIDAQGRKIDELFENHRSRKEILSAVDLVASCAQGIEPHHLEPVRTFADKAEPSVELIVGCAGTTEEATRVEAHRVARRIGELAGNLTVEDKSGQRPCRFRDIAVLARTVNALGPVERAFQQFHIPYLTEGGRTFYEAREVKDLVHLLRAIANPRDEIGLAGVLRSPLVGISDETLLRLRQIGNLGAALARLKRSDPSLFDPGDLERLYHFQDQLRRMRAERDDASPDRLLVRAIDDAAYESSLDLRARANVDKFLALVREWYRRRPRSLYELLQELEWLRSSASETDAPPDDSSDVVRLMTMHQAKGLQFPIVFLPALHKGIDRRKPPICLSAQAGLGARWRNPATGESLADLAHLLYSRELEQKEEAEENRLFYVAMTRAEEHLVLHDPRRRALGAFLRQDQKACLKVVQDGGRRSGCGSGYHR
jgi:ATP-dependent exoDNAse (exonuclease V) beta subunit